MMFIWQPDDPLYILLQTVKEYIILFLGITFLIGWVFITYYFISKPLRYLDEVVVATEQLVVPSDEPIVLPNEMFYAENELNRVPVVGCDTLSSALCMDKDKAHKLVSLAGISVPKSVTFKFSGKKAALKKIEKELSYPLFVKPVRAGSSFGITKVTKQQELENAIQLAFEHDAEVIVEETINGFEVGCAVLGIDELIVGRVDEIELSSGFFDYTEKYTLKSSKIYMPARIDAEAEKRIQETAVTIYKALGCSGFSRVDMFYTPSGEIVFNEVNTIPGFTSHSRYPNMMKGICLCWRPCSRIKRAGTRCVPYEYPKVDTPFFGEKKAADTFSTGTLFGRA